MVYVNRQCVNLKSFLCIPITTADMPQATKQLFKSSSLVRERSFLSYWSSEPQAICYPDCAKRYNHSPATDLTFESWKRNSLRTFIQPPFTHPVLSPPPRQFLNWTASSMWIMFGFTTGWFCLLILVFRYRCVSQEQLGFLRQEEKELLVASLL